jgi:23S rRNA (guanosine2251-2'-O)-methyltransferase
MKTSSGDTTWIYGKHSVKAALLNEKREILRLVLSGKDLLDELLLNRKLKLPKPEIADRNFFSSIFGKDAIHQGCAVLVKNLQNLSIYDLVADESDSRPVIFLDQITDPQNVGSILRAAAVFGARAVVVTENNSSCRITPAMSKVASGALETVPLIYVVNLVQSINFMKKHEFWLVGLDEKSEKRLDEIDLDGKFAFVIGGEGSGMRRLTKESCDFLVQLPAVGSFSTLNAAQAATVALYESLRQRKKI